MELNSFSIQEGESWGTLLISPTKSTNATSISEAEPLNSSATIMELNSFSIQEDEYWGTLLKSPPKSTTTTTSISEAEYLSIREFSSIDDDQYSSLVLEHVQTYILPSDESFFNAFVDQTSDVETTFDLSLEDFSSDDDHSSLALALGLAHVQTYNLPSDEGFFNALVDNDISLHTHLEQLSYCENQKLCRSCCIDKVKIDLLLGGADFSLQLFSLRDFLRAIVQL